MPEEEVFIEHILYQMYSMCFTEMTLKSRSKSRRKKDNKEINKIKTKLKTQK